MHRFKAVAPNVKLEAHSTSAIALSIHWTCSPSARSTWSCSALACQMQDRHQYKFHAVTPSAWQDFCCHFMGIKQSISYCCRLTSSVGHLNSLKQNLRSHSAPWHQCGKTTMTGPCSTKLRMKCKSQFASEGGREHYTKHTVPEMHHAILVSMLK